MNDFFHSNSAFSEFTELVLCLLGPSWAPEHQTYQIELKHCSVLQQSLTLFVCSAEAMYNTHSDSCCVHHATGKGPYLLPPQPLPPMTPILLCDLLRCMAVVLLPLWNPGDTYWRLVGLDTAGWYFWPECVRVQVMAAAQASPDSVLSARASHLHLVTGPALPLCPQDSHSWPRHTVSAPGGTPSCLPVITP